MCEDIMFSREISLLVGISLVFIQCIIIIIIIIMIYLMTPNIQLYNCICFALVILLSQSCIKSMISLIPEEPRICLLIVDQHTALATFSS